MIRNEISNKKRQIEKSYNQNSNYNVYLLPTKLDRVERRNVVGERDLRLAKCEALVDHLEHLELAIIIVVVVVKLDNVRSRSFATKLKIEFFANVKEEREKMLVLKKEK